MPFSVSGLILPQQFAIILVAILEKSASSRK